MSRTPKVARRRRGEYVSWQPPRPVYSRKMPEPGWMGMARDPVERWYARRHCDGTCDPKKPASCARLARLTRLRAAYGRRR